MMFSIDNTPQKTSNFLTKNINKLRSSTRKSPGKTSKKSPAQKSVRKNENNPAADSRAGVARTGKIGSSKSPQVATKGQKATSRSAKSPGLSTARKVNTHTDKSIQGFTGYTLLLCFSLCTLFPHASMPLVVACVGQMECKWSAGCI